MFTTAHPQPRHQAQAATWRVGLVSAGLVLAAAGLAACSSSTPSGNANPPPPALTTTKGESRHTESGGDKPSTAAHSETHTDKPTGGSGGSGLGFDGKAFQAAMANLGVAATGSEGGQGSTGIGTMAYKFTGSGQSISAINCTATSEAATTTQSDQNALTIASTFLTGCATWNQQGELKTQAANFVIANLSKLQPEQPVTNTIGATQLKLGKQAPGFYFLMLTQ